MKPGEIITTNNEITFNKDHICITIKVANTGDRPIQVGSHYHFAETNIALDFDRKISKGMRLDIPSGTAVRFEPGQIKNVDLIPFSGERKIFGFNSSFLECRFGGFEARKCGFCSKSRVCARRIRFLKNMFGKSSKLFRSNPEKVDK